MQRLASLLIIFIGAFALFYPTLSFDFAWLDQTEILSGKLIAQNWKEAFQMWIWDDGNHSAYHRPIYNWMHSLDLALWGDSPRGFHLTNMLLHSLNGVLIYTLLRRMTDWTWGALLLTLTWVAIPVQVPVVALIHAKGDLLSTFFLLGSFHFFLNKKSTYSVLGALCLLFALGSKEVAFIGIPIMTILLWQTKKLKLSTTVGMAIPTILMVVLRLLSTSHETENLIPFVDRMLTFPLVYGSYFWESLPGLRLGISDTVIAWNGKESLDLGMGIGFLLAAIGLQVILWKKVPRSRAFILLFNFMLIPVSQIIPTLHFRADRFLYLASLGWLGMWALAFKSLLSKWKGEYVMGILFLAWSIYQVNQELPIYKNNETLFTETIEREPNNREARGYMGLMSSQEGDDSHAIFHYSKALNANPKLYSFSDRDIVRANMGVSQMRLFQYDAALKNLIRASENLDSPVEMDFNIALCYKNIRQPQKAYEHFVRYQRKYPDDIKVMEKLVEVYVDLGKRKLALDEINRILKLQPNHPHAPSLKDAMMQIQNAR